VSAVRFRPWPSAESKSYGQLSGCPFSLVKSRPKGREHNMNSVQDAFKFNHARKNVIIGGAVILI
jgi:hypothetical protein